MADQQRTELLDNDALLASAVVANCTMNRERQLAGVNSYTRELGFNPVDVLTARLADSDRAGRTHAQAVAWLDVCCGTGRALIQAAEQLDRVGLARHAVLVGVDLVDAFDALAPGSDVGMELVCSPVDTWTATRRFDLITCVHGLHYVGDKLAVLTRAARWLTDTGRLVADPDLSSLSSIRLADRRAAGRRLTARLRAAGFTYDPAGTASAAPVRPTSTFPTPTWAPTAAPAPTTPVNLPCTPTTAKTTDRGRPPPQERSRHGARSLSHHRF